MNRWIKFLLPLHCFIILYFKTISQDLPKVIPPSPEAAALFRFQDYPVDYSTGLPQISIPLYEVKSGSLTLPITLSYHSSGRKVYDDTGAAGLGWTLQAGGMISRTVYGKPDDERWNFPSPFKREAELSNITDFLYLAAVGHHPFYPITYYDTQYDIFSYSANNLSGKFILKDENSIKSPVLIPYKPYVIEWHKVTTQYVVEYFDYINIIDDKGILYRFGKSLKDGTEYLEKSSEGVSSWLLTEIVSADKSDTIAFKYKTFVGERLTISQESQMLYHKYGLNGWGVAEWDYKETFVGNTNRAYYSMQRLTEIKFKEGKITFNLNPGNNITDLEVKNKANKIIKTIELKRSQLNTVSDGIKPVEKLNEVIFKDKFGNNIEKYAFQYYNTDKNFIDVRACDLWGYFNGRTNPSGVIDMRPFKVVPDESGTMAPVKPFKIEFDFNVRAPSNYILEGVLEKIIYPTGGSTKFIYELNRFFDPQSQISRDGGGLRVNQIITDDNKGNVSYKTFKYGEGESGYGFLNIIPSAENISDYSIEYSTSYQNFSDGAGGPVKDNSFTQCIVSSDVLPVFNYVSEKPVIYNQVTEYHGTLSDNIGKTVYKYDFDDRIAPQSVEGLFRFAKFRFWRTSELREKSDYKSTNNSGSITYGIQKTVKYNYTETETDLIYGLHFKKKYVCAIPNEPVSYSGMWNGGLTKTTGIDQYVAEEWGPAVGGPFGIDDWEVYKFGDYTISAGVKELNSVEEIEFHDINQFTTTTSYIYNLKHLIQETRKTVNQNQILLTEIKYPFDLPSDPVHQQMIARNMLNFEVEVNTFRDLIPLSSVKNTYKDWGNNLIKPEIISTRTGTAPYEPRITFHAYDNQGNIQSVSKDNGPKVIYLYGYGGQLPVAEVTNATHTQIFYQSFEETEGNSGENDAKTGRKSRTGGYTRTVTGLTNGTYNLTYFQKTSGIWGLVQVNNISVTTGTYNINLTGQIDEVRFYPQGAFMTTYTYDPMEGLLSATDQNNVTTYYEHDGYQRLVKIKDVDQNSLKQMDYHYKQ